MRGSDERTGSLFSYVDLESRVRRTHPLRTMREIANAALSDLSGDFDRLYTGFGRPSVAPEKLLRAMLLQAFYGVRSERLMENRHGLVVGGAASLATGTAEREVALDLLDRRLDRRLDRGRTSGRIAPKRITLGADKAYDVARFVHDLRHRSVTPHIAIDGHITKTGKRRRTAVDRRTTRHAGYEASQRCRKRIEEVFGWIKSAAGLAKVKLRGRARVDAAFTLALAAYNLVRLPKLLAAPA